VGALLVEDVRTVLTELRSGQRFTGTHHETFPMRREQAEAVDKTHAYFHSIWKEDMHAVPRFLWNAKMRFGKTFTAYQLAKKLGAKRVLVVTFKPAVEDAWQTDLESHVDFDGWQYLSRNSGQRPDADRPPQPVVYFGSFQDLLGRDAAGNIKPKNEWLHKVKWDLVVFDEYHFGAWRETAKELFEGEEEGVAKKEAKLEYAAGLEESTKTSTCSRKRRRSFCRSRRRRTSTSPARRSRLWPQASSSRNRSSTGRTPTSSVPRKSSPSSPGKWNPYGALPQMRLLTYQMPDELLAIASAGEFDEFDLNEFFSASVSGKHAQFKHKTDVQKWLDIIRGSYAPRSYEHLKTGTRPPFPYSDVRSAAVPAALVLVPAKRGGLSRDGEPACREAQHLLARL
jgi:hypothetical protein